MKKLLLSKREKKKHYRRLRFKIYIFGGLGLIVLAVLFYLLVHSPALKIQDTEITGIVNLDNLKAEVLKSRWSQFWGIDNLLAWPSQIGNVKIKKGYNTRVLKLIGPELERYAIWCAQSCYWVNKEGIAVEKSPDTEGSSIIKVADLRDKVLTLARPVFDNDSFKYVAGIFEGLASIPIRMQGYTFDGRLQELTAYGVNGEEFIFSTRFEPTGKLFASLAEVIEKNNLSNVEYIDLTVENRIYLKQF